MENESPVGQLRKKKMNIEVCDKCLDRKIRRIQYHHDYSDNETHKGWIRLFYRKRKSRGINTGCEISVNLSKDVDFKKTFGEEWTESLRNAKFLIRLRNDVKKLMPFLEINREKYCYCKYCLEHCIYDWSKR